MRGPIRLALGVLLLLGALALSASSALAAEPWWNLNSGSRPTLLPSEVGGKGEIVLTVANLGDAAADGETNPIVIEDTLPVGLKLRTTPEAKAGGKGEESEGPVTCEKTPLRCSFDGTLPPYDSIEVRMKVETRSEAAASEANSASVSGGGAPSVRLSHSFALSEALTPYGIENYELLPEEEGGTLATQAGSHPFQLTTSINLTQDAATTRTSYEANPVALTKDVRFRWPAGLLGNPSPLPRCTLNQFLTPFQEGNLNANACPPDTAVGVALVTVEEPNDTQLNTFSLPIFNLEPSYGEPARFGFDVGIIGLPVLIEPSVRSGPGEAEPDYGITVTTPNVSQIASLISTVATVWGVPSDPRHDNSRGWGCLAETRGLQHTACPNSEEPHPQAFLTLPTSCSGSPLQSTAEADSWLEPGNPVLLPVSSPMPTLVGCNKLNFSPTISAEPTTDRASAPTGLDFDLNFHDEGLTDGAGTAQSQLKKTVVTLPEGLTINPSAGVGLGGCTPADYERETLTSAPGEGCPNDSKLGTVEVTTPLLSTPIKGSIFIAQPYENPFDSLVALYAVLKNPETGILIKLPGEVTADPVTGRLTTTFDNNPQLAFDHFNFHFREGQQAPLVSPPLCGTYETLAQLTPWSNPTAALTDSSSFTITKGFDGGACPAGGVPPFAPQIQAGTLNNKAGSFSPLSVHLTRSDADQEISGFSTDLPVGLTGDLTGIPFCPEADIALARTKTGAQEEAAPSCPAASQIGHTLVGTGVGAVLAYVPGKLYLAGPFNGDPFSLVSVTSALVGPFDLGTVVIRFGLRIDPNTAQVSVDPSASEQIPTILRGIVTHVRDIRVDVDRPNFTLNPTNCQPLAISSTVTSNLGEAKTVSSPFQAVNCANLAFKPSFTVSTSGRTSRANGASIDAKLVYPKAAWGTQANIRSVKVKLPKQLPSRLSTLQKACTDKVFDVNPAACPAASRVGTATTTTPVLPVPLSGPVYFVSHAAEKFPELIVVLSGYGVTVDLHGETFIAKNGITSTTFATVPDVPVESFELKLPEGKYSALAANGNLCKQKLLMPTRMVAQNGAVMTQSTKIVVNGCAKAGKAKKPAKPKKKK